MAGTVSQLSGCMVIGTPARALSVMALFQEGNFSNSARRTAWFPHGTDPVEPDASAMFSAGDQ
jgi:hypothetical protein